MGRELGDTLGSFKFMKNLTQYIICEKTMKELPFVPR